MRQLRIGAIAVLTVAGFAAVPSQAQEVGDRVVVISRTADLKIGTTVVDTAAMGNVLLVSQVQGDWLAVSKGKPGWIHRRYVVPFDQAVGSITAMIRRGPRDGALYFARGMVYKESGDFRQALSDFNQAVSLGARSPAVYTSRGDAWTRAGDLNRALADYDAAIRLDSRFAAAYTSRGNLVAMTGDHDRAMNDYNRAIELDPQSPYAYSNRGNVFSEHHQFAKALADYNRAIELDPRFADAYNNRAWLRATCPDPQVRDGEKAVESAIKACELTNWSNPEWLDTLAAAYAEKGDFESAVEWQSKAIALVADNQKQPLETRLALYRENKPFRESADP